MNYSNNTKNSVLAKNGFLGRNLKIRVDDVSIQSFLVLHAKFHFSNFPIFAIPSFFGDTLYVITVSIGCQMTEISAIKAYSEIQRIAD